MIKIMNFTLYASHTNMAFVNFNFTNLLRFFIFKFIRSLRGPINSIKLLCLLILICIIYPCWNSIHLISTLKPNSCFDLTIMRNYIIYLNRPYTELIFVCFVLLFLPLIKISINIYSSSFRCPLSIYHFVSLLMNSKFFIAL